jgi:hypothetical protein
MFMAENQVPNMEPAQSPQPAPVQPQAAAQAPQGEPSNNKTVLFVVGAVVLLVAGVAGYGYWNGSQIKGYAENAEKIVKESDDWASTLNLETTMDSLTSGFAFEDGFGDLKSDFSEAKAKLEKLKASIEKDLAEVSKKSVPSKAKELDKNLKEYLSLAKKTSEEGIYALEIANSALIVMEGMTSLEDDMYSGEMDEAAIMDDVADLFDEWVSEIKKIKAPESVKEEHDKLVKTLEDLVEKLKDGDTDAFNDMDSPFEGLDKIGDPDESLDKMEDLVSKIKEEAASLKSVSFSF